LQNLTDFNLLDGFDAIRSDFTRITYGCYFAELVDSIASEGIANPEIFDLLRTTYQFLGHADDIPLLARGFEIKFLDCAGYGPELTRCVHCSSTVKSAFLDDNSEATNKFGVAFSVRYGGVLCGDCENRDGAAFTIAPGSCELLKMLRKSEWEQFNRIRASSQNHQELKRVLGSFIEYYTERNLKSLRFIENVL
jgi:DNA repair protein RecO (recombination protein O)